ncbi:hypothetical protein [Parabacteroides goldsteinii]|uniref:hypothetical protein n=1 Tax=Parabacteroides goldsteinii TaxID=328812 RepID=UPI002A8120B6|nr:hypothetical protein [Parabacteroides goldsteinii]
MKPIFKLISKHDVEIRADITGKNKFRISFVSDNIRISKPISKEEYLNYRDTMYLAPGKAKNTLLDKLSFDGTPFCREDFNFVDLKELSPDVERALKKFIDTLKRNQD